jgi:S-adenosylmethionine hydrolase
VTGRQGEKKTSLRVPGSPRPRVTASPRPRVSSPRLPVSPSPGSPRVPASPRLRVFSPRLPVPPSPRRRVITLLTDFGAIDYFVSSMKGVTLSLNPNARIVDITHEIPSQDVESGAFTLLATYGSFPAGTIHVAVVDPGVGSSRRAIMVQAGGQFFVGPDNGIFSYICDRQPDHRVFHLTKEEYFRNPVSATFHGRDIFAPVAAALSLGVNTKELGREIKNPVRLQPLAPGKFENGKLKARIIHVDRFGNCITNVTQDGLLAEMTEAGAQFMVNGTTIRSFKQFFAEETGNKDKLFAIWGSAGFLEIAAMNRSAAQILKARRGQEVTVSLKHD